MSARRTAIGVGLLACALAGTALAQVPILPGAPLALSVPAATTLSVTVETPGEIQIDATAVGADAQLALLRDGAVVAEDSDGGEGVNARIVTFVTPGTYEVAVWEWRGGPLTANVSAIVLAPLDSSGTLELGSDPIVVEAPAGDSTRRASAEASLEIAREGTYVVEAVGPTSGCDPQLVVVRDAVEIGRGTDGAAESDARWSGTLEPGSYRVRVHDWINRACTLHVSARER